MPPAGQADGVPQPRQPDLAGQADGVLLGSPKRVGRHRLLHAEPVPSGRAMASPVQPRVIGKDLDPGADDEDQQEDVEEVLPAHPCGKPSCGRRWRWLQSARVLRYESLHRRDMAKSLSHRHRREQENETDRQQPKQVEPPATPDAYPGGDAANLRHRARPRRRVDDILARYQLVQVAAHDVGRHARTPSNLTDRSGVPSEISIGLAARRDR